MRQTAWAIASVCFGLAFLATALAYSGLEVEVANIIATGAITSLQYLLHRGHHSGTE